VCRFEPQEDECEDDVENGVNYVKISLKYDRFAPNSSRGACQYQAER
jgi:hypothetical protein